MLGVVWLGIALGLGEALAVGPIFITIVRESSARGFRAGCGVILGATAVDALLLLPLLAGAGALAVMPAFAPWIGIACAPYLLYLALAAERDARQHRRGGGTQVGSPATPSGKG